MKSPAKMFVLLMMNGKALRKRPLLLLALCGMGWGKESSEARAVRPACGMPCCHSIRNAACLGTSVRLSSPSLRPFLAWLEVLLFVSCV